MPDTIPALSTTEQVTVTTAAGFVVVSEWTNSRGANAAFEYEHVQTLNDALEVYREYQDGEHPRARAMGIFTADVCGLPLNRLEPLYLLKLMRELRAG